MKCSIAPRFLPVVTRISCSDMKSDAARLGIQPYKAPTGSTLGPFVSSLVLCPVALILGQAQLCNIPFKISPHTAGS